MSRYPLHVTYIGLYALTLSYAGLTIITKIPSKKSRWGARINFSLLLIMSGVLFGIGYTALGGFEQANGLGILVLTLYLMAAIGFFRNVNSRNAAFLPLIFLLSNAGFLMLYRLSLSSSRIVTTEFLKQIIFTAVGLLLFYSVLGFLKIVFLVEVHGDRLAMLGISRLKVMIGRLYQILIVERNISYHFWLVLTLILLAIPLIFGAGMRLSLGMIQVQPSEFVKVTFVIYLTYHLTRYRQRVGAWDEPIVRRVIFLIPPVITLSLPFLGYILQRDFGPLMLYSLLILCMFFVGTSRLLEVGIILAIFIGTIVVYNQFFPYINAVIPKYASIIIDRINIWQNPWLYTRGEQIVRSLWAIKAAGLWGTGLGLGHPEFFPSEVQHDFIFTLLVHELGLAGGVLVVLNYLLFCWQGIRIAVATKYDIAWNEEWAWFRLRLALGCTLVLFFQAMINIGGVINFSLMTGITLPYISYGGTSILVSYLLAGILAFCSFTAREIP